MSGNGNKITKLVALVILATGCTWNAFGEGQATLVQVVGKAPTKLALSTKATSNAVEIPAPVEVDGSVTGVAGLPPTGTVTYTATDQQGGVIGNVLPVTRGVADWIANALTTGTYSISATYSGDANYLPSSAALSTAVVVSGSPDFSLTMDSLTGTVKQGNTWKANATLKAINGFTGIVALSCTNPETQMTCNFDSASVQLTPASNSVVLVNVVTVATTVTTLSGLGMIFCFGGFGGTSRRRAVRKGYGLAALATFAVLATGCGVKQRYAQTNGTPRGTYNLVITATSGSLVHSQQVQVTVQ